MSFSLFSVAILLLFFAVLSLEIYRGITKGFFLSLISLGTVAASVAISVLLTPVLAMLVTGLFFDVAVEGIGEYQELLAEFASMGLLIEAVVSAVVSTLLFVGVFYLVRWTLNLIIRTILHKKLKSDPRDPDYRIEKNSYFDRHRKLLGGVVGGVSALIITMVLTTPIMGTLDVASQAIQVVHKVDNSTAAAIGEENIESIEKYSTDIPGNIFYQLGGKLMFSSVASTYMYNEKVYLLPEVDTLKKTVDDFMLVYDAFQKPEEVNREQIEGIHQLCDDIEGLEMCNGVLADVLSRGADVWRRGNLYFDIPKPEVNELVDPAFDEILIVCSNTDNTNANLNFTTLLKIYAVILDSGVIRVNITDYDETMAFLTEHDMLDQLTEILDQNPYMSGVNISSIAMTALSHHLMLYNYDAEKVDVLADGIADAINTVNIKGYGEYEEKLKALAEYTVKYTNDYGVTVPEEVAELVAHEFFTSVSDIEGDVTAENVIEIFEKYFE